MVHGLRKLADKAHLFAKGGTQTSHRRLPGIKNCYEWCSVGRRITRGFLGLVPCRGFWHYLS